LQTFKRCSVDLEGDFPGIVISPEKHAMPSGIIASAWIRKMERHAQTFVALGGYRHFPALESISE
jgi:hypothetical protein